MSESYYSEALGVGVARLLELRLIREIRLPQPAAGVEWSAVVPGGTMLELLEVSYQLTTSVVVANRSSNLQVVDQDGIRVARWGTSRTHAASLALVYGYSAGLGSGNTQGGVSESLPAPAYVLYPGHVLSSTTVALDVGDQYAAITLTVRQWSENDLVRTAMQIDQQLSALTAREVTGR